MASFVFVGDPSGADSPEAVEVFGLRFPLNEPVEVTDAMAIRKLSHNAHFICGAAPADDAGPAPAKKRGRPRREQP